MYMDKYISVDEFAAAAKTSKQNIYKQLETRLKPYRRKDNTGRTVIDTAALSLFYNAAIEGSEQQPETTAFNQIEQPIEQPIFSSGFGNSNFSSCSTNSTQVEQLEQPIETGETPQKIDYTQQYIDNLLQQIEQLRAEKEQITAAKDKIIAEKDLQLQEYHSSLANLLIKQQELTEKALNTTGNAQLLQAADKITEQQPQKKSILKRIFGSKEDNSGNE